MRWYLEILLKNIANWRDQINKLTYLYIPNVSILKSISIFDLSMVWDLQKKTFGWQDKAQHKIGKFSVSVNYLQIFMDTANSEWHIKTKIMFSKTFVFSDVIDPRPHNYLSKFSRWHDSASWSQEILLLFVFP